MKFAKDAKELNERWRKRVKYQMLDLKHSMGDLKKARKKLHKRYSLLLKDTQNLQKIKSIVCF